MTAAADRAGIICPVELTLSLISNKWKALIIRDLLMGTKRFSELQKSLNGVTQKVLTANLRAMEEDGLVHREIYAEVPPRVEYSLTELGQSLRPLILAMVAWGMQYKKRMGYPLPELPSELRPQAGAA